MSFINSLPLRGLVPSILCLFTYINHGRVLKAKCNEGVQLFEASGNGKFINQTDNSPMPNQTYLAFKRWRESTLDELATIKNKTDTFNCR
jgi:hypothetical protein